MDFVPFEGMDMWYFLLLFKHYCLHFHNNIGESVRSYNRSFQYQYFYDVLHWKKKLVR